MDIQNTTDIAELLKKLSNNTLPDTFIELSGFAKFKNEIFKAFQALDKPNLLEELSKKERDIYDSLSMFDKEQASTLKNAMLTSYYTPDYLSAEVTAPISKFIRTYNQDSLNILEPSAGTGSIINNFKMSRELDISTIDAVELDFITSEILKHNFSGTPKIEVHNQGFEDFQPKKDYDFVIGNVPFGNYSIYDKQLDSTHSQFYHNQIHNYFFIKSIELTKPGGVIALITTSSMIDNASNQNFRKYLMDNTNLISVSRFDNRTFSKAGTSVVSDLIILQKPTEKKENLLPNEREFLEAETYEDININKIFSTPQGSIYGNLKLTTGIAGRPTLTVERTEVHDKLTKGKLSEDISQSLEVYGQKKYFATTQQKKIKPDENENLVKRKIEENFPLLTPGNIVHVDNSFYITRVGSYNIDNWDYIPLSVPKQDQLRVIDIIELRDIYKEMRHALREKDIETANRKQQELNTKYDYVNFLYGDLNLAPNRKIINKDIESDLISSLEIKNGKYFQRSAIFTSKLSIEQEKKVSLSSIEDAIGYSLSEFGEIDEPFIASHFGKDWVKEALEKQLVFLDPVIKDFDTIETYKIASLSKFQSGYIEGKYTLYTKELLKKNNPYYGFLDKDIITSGVRKLSEVIPLRLTLKEINPSLGENWMPLDIYKQFGRYLYNDQNFSIHFTESLDSFNVSGGYTSQAYSNYSVERPSGQTISPFTVFQYAMEQSVPNLTKTIFVDGNEKRVTDKKTMDRVMLIYERINKEFEQWLFTQKNPEELERLAHIYHLKNNAIVKEKFDASKITFSPLAGGIEPRSIQKNCAWEITQSNGGIIDHKVGFGKTISMAMANQTKIKFGKVNKELLVALNANYVDVYQSFKSVYPKGKFLLVTPDDLKPENKQATFYKIANNPYDCIITAHSCIMKFPPAPESDKKIYSDMITEIENSLSPENKSFLSRRESNSLEKKLANAKAKYERAKDRILSKKEKGSLIWEDLGIDSIVIDESQFFKNLTYNTRHTRVAGLGTQKETQKTSNLLSFIRATQELHHQRSGKWDKGVTFVSGTTISNSVTELYLIFKYLTPKHLENKNITCFDQWARQHCRKDHSYETSLSGEVKLKERFRYFVKVPELAKDYTRITNYADENTFKIVKPDLKHHLVTVEPTEVQLDYFEHLQKFAATKDPKNLIGVADNENTKKAVGLICTNQGKKAALDMRLLDPEFGRDKGSKISIMAEKAVKHYQDYDTEKGTQLIFCDTGTPGGKNFNLYKAIKEELTMRGIPKDEVAFVHSYKSKKRLSKLWEDVNEGKIRFLLGSTQKLGVGVNVQKKLVAAHHLDWPWRPTDLDQRNGRIDRQGNELLVGNNNEANVYYYATKKSLDAYTLNLIQIKANFIHQIKNASISLREIDEGIMGNDGGLNAEQFMAVLSENEHFNQKLIAEKKLEKLLSLEAAHNTQIRQNKWRLKDVQNQLDKATKTSEKLDIDVKTHDNLEKCFEKSEFLFDNTKSYDLKNFGKMIANEVKKQFKPFQEWSKFSLKLMEDITLSIRPKHEDMPFGEDNYKLIANSPSGIKYTYGKENLVKDDAKNGEYVLNCLRKVPKLHSQYKNRVVELEKEKGSYLQANETKFDRQSEIKEMKNEIKHLDELIKKAGKNNGNDNDKDKGNDKGNDKGKGPKM